MLAHCQAAGSVLQQQACAQAACRDWGAAAQQEGEAALTCLLLHCRPHRGSVPGRGLVRPGQPADAVRGLPRGEHPQPTLRQFVPSSCGHRWPIGPALHQDVLMGDLTSSDLITTCGSVFVLKHQTQQRVLPCLLEGYIVVHMSNILPLHQACDHPGFLTAEGRHQRPSQAACPGSPAHQGAGHPGRLPDTVPAAAPRRAAPAVKEGRGVLSAPITPELWAQLVE